MHLQLFVQRDLHDQTYMVYIVFRPQNTHKGKLQHSSRRGFSDLDVSSEDEQ